MPSMRVPVLLCASAAALAVACAPHPVPPGAMVIVAPPVEDETLPTQWKQVIKPGDAARLEGLADIWREALAQARIQGHGKAIDAEGPLLDPGGAQPRPAPPPGVYHCRMIKLGMSGTGRKRAFQAFKPFFCYIQVEGPLLTFVKGAGTQRPAGRLWDDSDSRLVFLGSVAYGLTGDPPAYGANAAADQAGIVERVADFRWRMVLPRPAAGSLLDVIELVPDAPPVPQEAVK